MKVIQRNIFMLRCVFFILVLSLAFTSCEEEKRKEDILVSIGDKNFSRKDLSELLPDNLSRDDSIMYSEKIINNWISNQLILQVAASELPNIDKINEMADLYRSQLISYEYRKRLILSKNSKFKLPEDSLINYYNLNSNKFILESPIIKGIYIKVSEKSPQLKDVRKWVKGIKPKDVENLENYGLDDAIIYDYFLDKWIDWNNIEKNIPYNFKDSNAFVKSNKTFEITKNGFVYLLNISDYKLGGSIMPFDLARDRIEEMYLNENQLMIDAQIKKMLYDEALRSGKMKLNYKENN